MKSVLLRTCVTAFTFTLTAASLQASAQDIVKLKHENYTSYFSMSKHIPVLITYDLTPAMYNCDGQIRVRDYGSDYVSDPLLPDATNLDNDYDDFGYEAGMNMPVRSNACSMKGYNESFYYSNLIPMPSSLKQTLWVSMEKRERATAKKYGNIKVFSGTTGKTWAIGRAHNVEVPKFVWKVIYIPSTKEYQCYSFRDEVAYYQDDFLDHHKTDLATIEKLAGVHFSGGDISADYIR